MQGKRYTKEENDFLIENCKGKTGKEITELFNNKFGCNKSRSAIVQHIWQIGLGFSLIDSKYKKGHKSLNKGKKNLYESANAKEIGSEKIRDGYVYIKVSKLPSKWVPKHRFIYEQYHNVKLTDKDTVVFVDGNKRNFDINNLQLLNYSELGALSNFKLTKDVEINKTIINLSKLKSKIVSIKNKNSKHGKT